MDVSTQTFDDWPYTTRRLMYAQKNDGTDDMYSQKKLRFRFRTFFRTRAFHSVSRQFLPVPRRQNAIFSIQPAHHYFSQNSSRVPRDEKKCRSVFFPVKGSTPAARLTSVASDLPWAVAQFPRRTVEVRHMRIS